MDRELIGVAKGGVGELIGAAKGRVEGVDYSCRGATLLSLSMRTNGVEGVVEGFKRVRGKIAVK